MYFDFDIFYYNENVGEGLPLPPLYHVGGMSLGVLPRVNLLSQLEVWSASADANWAYM